MTTRESGFGIRGTGGGYYDMNGIGDWSLAGDAATCELFASIEAAEEVVDESLDNDGISIVQITRTVVVQIGECVLARTKEAT